MKTLLLMRHAKSARPEEVEDFDRPLSERGESDARLVGAWLRDNGPLPQKALVSDARRTRETWEALELEDTCPVRFLRELYDASPAQVLGALSRQDADRILVVGHNPTAEALAAHLLRQVATPAGLDAWKPGTLAVIGLEADAWPAARTAPARLLGWTRPHDLDTDRGRAAG